MKLQDYKDKGVKEFTVTNGQAVAINPYTPLFQKEWKPLEDFTNANPPLPCHESVIDGTYPIDRFEEQGQIYNGNTGRWINAKINPSQFYDDTDQSVRTVLILSEPKCECTYDAKKVVIYMCKKHQAEYGLDVQLDEVAEKPEGEWYAENGTVYNRDNDNILIAFSFKDRDGCMSLPEGVAEQIAKALNPFPPVEKSKEEILWEIKEEIARELGRPSWNELLYWGSNLGGFDYPEAFDMVAERYASIQVAKALKK